MRTSYPAQNLTLAVVLAIASVAMLVWPPAFVSFTIAVIVAICWCIWLERHPLA